MSRDKAELELDAEIQRLLQVKRDLRRAERGLKAREIALSTQEQVGTSSIKKLKDQLNETLPSYMIPSNVGGIDSVQWPFLFSIDFDLGTDPAFNFSLRQTRSFQVTQEAGFLIMSISHYALNSSENRYAPLELDIIDRQSSRRFMNSAIPVQTLGYLGLATVLPTPMLVMPNAGLDLTLSSMINTGVTYTGQIKHQFTFFGYRVRIDNAENVLSTIFG